MQGSALIDRGGTENGHGAIADADPSLLLGDTWDNDTVRSVAFGI